MKPFKLSVLAAACVIALTACSSGKDTVNDYLNSQANQAQEAANKKAKAAKEERDAANAKLREAESKLQTAQNSLAEAEKKLAEAGQNTASSQALEEALAAKANAEKQLSEAQKQVADATAAKAAAEKQAADATAAKVAAEKQAADATAVKAAAEKQAADATAAKATAEKQAADAAAAKTAAEKQAADATAAKTAAEKQATDAATAKAAAEKQAADALAAKTSAEKQAEQDRLEKEKAEAELAKLKAEKQAEEDRLAEETRKDKERVEANVETVKAGFVQAAPVNNLIPLSGSVFSVEEGKFTAQPLDKDQSLNKLVVDGVTMQLLTSDEINTRRSETQSTFLTKNIDNSLVSEGSAKTVSGQFGSLPKTRFGNEFTQLRYGYVTVDGKTTLFVQGHATPLEGDLNSPFNYSDNGAGNRAEGLRALTTDKNYVYRGSAFYGKDGSYKQIDTKAVADFDNKKVRVELTENGQNQLTFGGNIEGNGFAGTYNGVETKGAFYGTKGQDIGGVFYQTEGVQKDYHGVFGATRNNTSTSTWFPVYEEAEKDVLKDFDVK